MNQPEAPGPSTAPGLRPLVGFPALGVFVLWSGLFLIALVGVVAGVGDWILGEASTATEFDPADPATPGFLVATMVAQAVAMAGVAFFLSLRVPAARPWGRSLWSLRPTAIVTAVLLAAFGALVGSGFSILLTEYLGWFSEEHLNLLEDAIRNGSTGQLVAFSITVVVLAPLSEEYVFRGYLWEALGRTSSPGLVFVVTSVAFAAYHFDPLHSLALLPTALLFGWIRLQTGSLGPCVLAHVCHNSLAMASILGGLGQEPVLGAIHGLGLGIAVILFVLLPRLSPAREEDGT